MPADRFAHVETWVFDLDNTLYPHSLRLFDQVTDRMRAYVMRALALDEAAADALRHRYWQEHGTTLAGLMENHAIDPLAFLDDVHEIDLGGLTPNGPLAAAIAALPGRKIVYTNGSRRHAERVTQALGMTDLFEALYGIEDSGFQPKPRRMAFERVFEADGLEPAASAMIEDDQRNLVEPAAMGLATIWHPADSAAPPGPHVHHVAPDLAAFLSRLV
jgi:putative hydrolase of the HAD superfamily